MEARNMWTRLSDISGKLSCIFPQKHGRLFFNRIYGYFWKKIKNPFYNGQYWVSRD